MAIRDTKRVCPFCGEFIRLDDCAIVATASSKSGRVTHIEDGLGEQTRNEKKDRINGYEIVRPAAEASAGWFARHTGRLSKPSELASPSLLPRRVCSECEAILPEELDDLDAVILSVVGLNRAGKSYFLGAALTAATRNSALADYGVRSFTPLEDTAHRLHNDYFVRLFRNEYKLDATQPNEHLEKSPLIFQVEMDDGTTFLLVAHDVSGEALMNRRLRASTADFVSRSDGIVFIADPRDMHQVVNRISAESDSSEEVTVGDRTLDQGSLLEAVLRDVERRHPGKIVPLALVIAQSDRLTAALGRQFLFSLPRTDPNWQRDVTAIGAEVRALLLELNERKLVELTERHRPSSFHAVSVLGAPELRGADGRPAPVRVMEPLGTIVVSVHHLLARAR